MNLVNMGKWKIDTTEFEEGSILSKDEARKSSIPKPVIDKLGNPDTINFIM
jgi:hypothetical protein